MDKSGGSEEQRAYLEAESRGLGVSPSWILWGFLAGRLAGRLETWRNAKRKKQDLEEIGWEVECWRNAKAEEGEIWKRLDNKSDIGGMPR